jgi:hypothetical protein
LSGNSSGEMAMVSSTMVGGFQPFATPGRARLQKQRMIGRAEEDRSGEDRIRDATTARRGATDAVTGRATALLRAS